MARALLLLYPRPFRREFGPTLVGDVRRRALELSPARAPIRLLRLLVSLALNAAGAWIEHARGAVHLRLSWLDMKLGARMLVRYPGLTAVAGLGITIAMVISIGFFSSTYWYFHPSVPLPDGDRLVGLENRDRRTYQADRRLLYDFVTWRAEVKTVEDLTASRTVARNLIVPGRAIEQVLVSEITPSGFRLARVPPLLGRTLIDADAAPGAPPALVVGFDVWQRGFEAAPDIVGRAVRLGATPYTIVGVMPEKFAFPVNNQYWIPLRIDGTAAPGEGRPMYVSGRLAPGVDMDRAEAELAVIGTRLAAQFPATHGHLHPEVQPYTYPFAGMTRRSTNDLGIINALFTFVLIVVCANVAILVYARTATRTGELAVRSALGARRGRIIAQLFVESLVLTTASAAVGVWLVALALEWMRRVHQMPEFWRDYRLPPTAVLYAAGLAVGAAVITGVLPALQATGRRLQTNLMQFNDGAGLRLGRVWTSLIVAQVAIAVAAIPIIVALGWAELHTLASRPAFAVDEYIAGVMAADSPDRLVRRQSDLSRRLDADPAFGAHAFVRGLPFSEPSMPATIDDAPARYPTQSAVVDADFFAAMDLPLLAGRGFVSADADDEAAEVVVVNRALADRLGGQALGRRLRYAEEDPANPRTANTRAYDIVGVVENAETNRFNARLIEPRAYHPLRRADRSRASVLVRARGGDSTAAANRLRDLVAGLDPNMTLDPIPLGVLYRGRQRAMNIAGAVIGIAIASVLLLSAAGIYAMMSFIVTQRRREIAIRIALGAERRQLLGGIFSRALRQVAGGTAAGLVLAWLLDKSSGGEALMGYGRALLPATVALISLVSILAALGPARRGLRIEPAAALKGE